ncbi:MAG: hypothetical protein ACFFDN_39630 [Candidatus Hodarchaeota archaeon]
MEKKNSPKLFLQVKENLFLIIPMACIVLWAIIFLIMTLFNPIFNNFQFIYFDYKIWYGAGQQIHKDATKLYSTDYGYDISYTWMPCWAMIFAFSLSLIPYAIGYFILYTINILSGILFVREFNKILLLYDVKKKMHRFLFLIIISNGFVILNIFMQNQTKLMVALIIFYILRREIHYRKGGIEKNFKYNLINYFLFVFMIGMAPYFIFLLLIYIFQDIKFKDVLKKDNMKIYAIVLSMFLIQNILFIIFPVLIFEFLEGFSKNANFFIFYLSEWLLFTDLQITVINSISTIILAIITLILLLKTELKIELKFAYFALVAIFIGLFANRVLSILLPLILLIFIQFLKQHFEGIEFIKQNKILLIGIVSIAGIYLNVNAETIYSIAIIILPFLAGPVLMFFIFLRWIILLSIMACSLLKLILSYNKEIEL